MGSYNALDVVLRQDALSNIPSLWVSVHDAEIKIDVEYYNEDVPVMVPVTVNVFHVDTLISIKNCQATIKSGPRVIADGYTDSNGTVTFQNIEVGSYTLRVIMDGYTMLDDSIQVLEPAVEYDVYLTPIPAEPLPWWTLPAAVGGIGIVGLVLLNRKGYSMPPIIVMR